MSEFKSISGLITRRKEYGFPDASIFASSEFKTSYGGEATCLAKIALGRIARKGLKVDMEINSSEESQWYFDKLLGSRIRF